MLEESPPQGRALALKPNYFHETNTETDQPNSSPCLQVLALFFFFFFLTTCSAEPVWSCPVVAVRDNLLETFLVYIPRIASLHFFSPLTICFWPDIA